MTEAAAPWEAAEPTPAELCARGAALLALPVSLWHLCSCWWLFPVPPAQLDEFLHTRGAEAQTFPWGHPCSSPSGQGSCPSLPSLTALGADLCLFLSPSPSSCSFLLSPSLLSFFISSHLSLSHQAILG